MKIVIYAILFSLSIVSAKELLLPGTQAPRFLIKSTSGKRVGLRDYTTPKAGKIKPMTLFSFWSLSCIPCRKEMPVLNSYYNKNKENVNLAFINLDTKDKSSEVQQFMRKYKITAPVLLDIYQSTGKKFNICEGKNCNVPALYILDASGTIRFAIPGYDEQEDMTKKLNGYLAEIISGKSNETSVESGVVTSDSLKLSIVHDALIKSPFKDLEKKYGMSKKEIIEILKESEDILKKAWHITSPTKVKQ